MVFCGYNDTMANGIRLFVEGMIEAMLARHNSGASMDEVLRTELDDLAHMNDVLKSVNHRQGDLLNALVSLNTVAQTLFARALAKNPSADEFCEECRKSSLELIELVKLTEERHMGELQKRDAAHGNPAAIEAVARWLIENAK